MFNLEQINRMKGGYFGLAIGDSLGGPYQFLEPNEVRLTKEYKEGGFLFLRKGEWSDDTSMMLCLSKSLIENKNINLKDQSNKYHYWMVNGYCCTREKGFDIGGTTKRTIFRNTDYTEEQLLEIPIEDSNNWANGGMMRMIPVPIFFQNYSKRNLIKYIINTTKITHNSKVCIDSNIVFGQLIVNAIKGFGKENLYKDIDFSNIDDRVKERYFKPLEDGYVPNVLPTGSVLNCIELSIYALYKFNSYIDGLLWLLQFGKDSDTVGAIYGQLAGSIYGFDSLDSYYVENLMNKEFIEEIFKELIENIPKEGFIEKVRSFV